MSDEAFANQSKSGEIPSYDGDEKAKATDFANYFCSYAQLYHQKQMLVDHNRMASYHQAIMGNAEVFKDKVSDRLSLPNNERHLLMQNTSASKFFHRFCISHITYHHIHLLNHGSSGRNGCGIRS